LAPMSVYFFGEFRNSTNSSISILACSRPATSENLILTFLSTSNLDTSDLVLLVNLLIVLLRSLPRTRSCLKVQTKKISTAACRA
jgi:hypothetical protein